jgi:hypothetical protein
MEGPLPSFVARPTGMLVENPHQSEGAPADGPEVRE